MKEDFDTEKTEAPELTLIRCPVCGKVMAAINAPDMTGWLRCCYNHKTTYYRGLPVETTKGGNTIWQAS